MLLNYMIKQVTQNQKSIAEETDESCKTHYIPKMP